MSKNSEDNNLQEIQEQIEGLANNKELNDDQKAIVNNMSKGLENLERSETLKSYVKEFKKADLMLDAVQDLKNLGNPNPQLDQLQEKLTKEVDDRDINMPEPLKMPKEYQRLSDPEANKIAPELEEAKQRIENLSKNISDPKLSKKVESMVQEMNSQLDNYGDRGLDDQSKRMLNTVDAIHSITKNSKNNLSKDFKGVSDEIHNIRTEKNLKRHNTRSEEEEKLQKKESKIKRVIKKIKSVAKQFKHSVQGKKLDEFNESKEQKPIQTEGTDKTVTKNNRGMNR